MLNTQSAISTTTTRNWGSIPNTSKEGGRTNPDSAIRGDRTGTAFQPLYDHFGDDQSIMAGSHHLYQAMIKTAIGNASRSSILDGRFPKRPETTLETRLETRLESPAETQTMAMRTL